MHNLGLFVDGGGRARRFNWVELQAGRHSVPRMPSKGSPECVDSNGILIRCSRCDTGDDDCYCDFAGRKVSEATYVQVCKS